MNSTAQMTDNNFEKSGPDKKENKVKGLYTIYSMNSTAQMTDNNKKSGPDRKENEYELEKTDDDKTNIHKSPRYKCS